MVTEVELNNYRQYKHAVVKFTPGLNVVVGNNFSGKSTIFEAVRFALFGTKTLEDKANTWIRDGERDGSVTLRMNVAGSKVEVFRNKENATLTVNGVHVASYKSEVSKLVEELLGVSLTTLEVGYCIRQKELAWFSSLTAGKKRKEVERLTKLDRLDFALARVKEDRNSTEIALQTISRELQPAQVVEKIAEDAKELLHALELDLSGAEKLVIDTTETLWQESAKLLEVTSQLKELKTKAAWRQAAEQYVTSATQRTVELAADISTCAEQVKRLQELGDTAYDLQRFDALVDALKSHEAARKRRAVDLADITDIQQRLATFVHLDAELDLAQHELQDRQAARSEWVEAKARLWAECTSLEDMITKAVAGDVCPLGGVCDSKTKNVQDRVKALKKRHADAQHEHAVLLQNPTDSVVVLSDKVNKLKVKIGTRNELLRREIELARWLGPELENKSLSLDAAKKDLAGARANHEEYLKVHDALERYAKLEKELSVVEAELKDNRRQVAALHKELQNLPALLESEGTLKVSVAELKSAIERAEATRKGFTSAAARALSNLQLAEQEVLRQRELLKEVRVASARVAELSGYLKHLQGFKITVSSKLLPRIRSVANGIFNTITNDRYAELLVDANFDVRAVTHDKHVRNLKSLAGSEEDLANLALRMALGTLMASKARRIDFALLDEVSAHLDDNMIRRMTEGLLELTKVFGQIAIITHRGIEEEYAANVIRVVETPKGSAIQ